MSKLLTRRRLLLGGVAALGGLTVAGWKRGLSPARIPWIGLGDALTYSSHRLLIPADSMAREFNFDQITPLPAIGTTNPESENYQRLLKGNFVGWRLQIDGLVQRPSSVSLADLKRFPSRTQVTQQSCEEGWTGIAGWTGVQLSRVLETVGVMASARYCAFHCVDDWWDCIDMGDALHPQTLLAYGMNGGELPVAHGAPVRLRVERQLGHKSLKYVDRLTLVERLDEVEDGMGANGAGDGYAWYGGI